MRLEALLAHVADPGDPAVMASYALAPPLWLPLPPGDARRLHAAAAALRRWGLAVASPVALEEDATTDAAADSHADGEAGVWVLRLPLILAVAGHVPASLPPSPLTVGRAPVPVRVVAEFVQAQLAVAFDGHGGHSGDGDGAAAGLGTLPRTVVGLLQSHACHGAIRFGDAVSVEQARALVSALAACQVCRFFYPSATLLLAVLMVRGVA